MENSVVTHVTQNGKYRIKIEKAAGVKTGDGFTVEVNGDNMQFIEGDAKTLYGYAKDLTKPSIPAGGTEVKEGKQSAN